MPERISKWPFTPVHVAEDELRGYLPGWRAYFYLTEEPLLLHNRDGWIRRRLRMVILKQWKQGSTVFRRLPARGISKRLAQEAAAHAKRWWCIAGHPALQTAFRNSYFAEIGVPSLSC